MKLAEKRKIWAQATPGPITTDGPQLCGNGTTIDVDGYTIATMLNGNHSPGFARHITNPAQMLADAQRFADSTHLPALVEALEKQKEWHWKRSEECLANADTECAVEMWRGLSMEHLTQAYAIDAALKSLDDPEKK